MLTSTYR
ncbi:hypothetical protein VCHENC02_2461A, partial [Vibrio harveyi]